jgi:Tfx family DNA-binding protein
MMKQGLITDRQKEVLRYRKQGMTQQQIADLIHTSKANICTIEKAAVENIRKAKETLEFLYTLDATHIYTIRTGTDVLDAVKEIFDEAEKIHIKVRYDTISLVNRMRESVPERIKGRFVRENIDVYINEDGELYFG